MPDIMHRITIHTTPERVYAAIATAEGLRNWWTRDAAIDSKNGGAAEFGFYDHVFVIKASVDELTPPAHVGWNKVTSTHGGFDGTSIAFDLQPQEQSTVLAFAHRGFKRADDNYAAATTRWGYYLVSLKRYLEAGTGNPNPDDIDF